jgi:dienelactone hydrolase
MEQMTFEELTNELMRLYPQGKYTEALEIVTQHADHFPEQKARTTFWKMCLLSLCGRSDEVISLFQKGLDSGLWWARSQFGDTDLDAVRDMPEFKRLMAESSKRCMEMQAFIEPARTLLLPEDTTGKLPLLIGLHGRNGHADSNLEHWETARRHGWLVLSPQSRQALYQGSYCWDDSEQGLREILFHLEEVMQLYNVDRERIVMGGFSQGSGMAIYAAFSGNISVRGFIGVGTFIAEPDSLVPLARQAKDVRGYFITGEKDHTLDKAKAIQRILEENNIQFSEEVYPDLGHEFPPDFGSSFGRAIEFILE